jgi:general secretion pathway protein I
VSRAAQTGFTLVEVLVAVATLAIAMSVFLSGASQYADNAHYMQQRSLATWVAGNRLTEMTLIQPWPDEGVDEGTAENGGQLWGWRSEVTESPDPLLRKVEVSVYSIQSENEPLDEDSNPLARLTGYVSEGNGAGAGGVRAGPGGDSAADSVIRNNMPEGVRP